MLDDKSHRYAPTEVYCQCELVQAQRYIFHPPGQKPANAPIVDGIGVLEVVTERGSRWYGCDRAYINAELRMVVVGHNSRDEVRQRWPIVAERNRVG